MQERKEERKNARKKRTDGRMDKQTGRQTALPDNRQTKPLNSSRFLEISRTNYREQISCLEIRELNLIFPVPIPKDGNGKIKKPNKHHNNVNVLKVC